MNEPPHDRHILDTAARLAKQNSCKHPNWWTMPVIATGPLRRIQQRFCHDCGIVETRSRAAWFMPWSAWRRSSLS